MNLNSTQLCAIIKGEFLHQVQHDLLTGVFINSRESNSQKNIFFAIKGEHFDGHNFLQQAVQAGAKVLVVHKDINLTLGVTVIKVDNTLKALQKLASYIRGINNICVIGITGSSGKTTTKHFCFQLLKNCFSVTVNSKSFNNIYGVALTLLSITKKTRILIQELGSNQSGEIKLLSQLAKPDIVTVTHVGQAHIGKFGSADKIAQEKQEIYISNPKALPIFNLDNYYTQAMYQDFKAKNNTKKAICFSSQDKKADVFLYIKKLYKAHLHIAGHFNKVSGEVLVPVTGAVNLNNILAASALVMAAGLKVETIWERLAYCYLPAGRNQWVKLNSGAEALFDAYNASPESIIALLDHFLSPIVNKKKFLILGDFLELGDNYLYNLQQTIAQKIVTNNLSLIWFIGEQANSFKKTLDEAGFLGECYFSSGLDVKIAQKIVAKLDTSVALAFKSSRKIQLENILMYFKPVDTSINFT